jgi:hypothetical protein
LNFTTLQISDNEELNEGFNFGKQHRRSYPIDLEKERCKILKK